MSLGRGDAWIGVPVQCYVECNISMDFIEKLPPSSRYDTILVIVDQLTKQSIFVLTVDTITAPMLAQLFVLHVFSNHGVPSHVTSDCVWSVKFLKISRY